MPTVLKPVYYLMPPVSLSLLYYVYMCAGLFQGRYDRLSRRAGPTPENVWPSVPEKGKSLAFFLLVSTYVRIWWQFCVIYMNKGFSYALRGKLLVIGMIMGMDVNSWGMQAKTCLALIIGWHIPALIAYSQSAQLACHISLVSADNKHFGSW